jgi:hypothetical protein
MEVGKMLTGTDSNSTMMGPLVLGTELPLVTLVLKAPMSSLPMMQPRSFNSILQVNGKSQLVKKRKIKFSA